MQDQKHRRQQNNQQFVRPEQTSPWYARYLTAMGRGLNEFSRDYVASKGYNPDEILMNRRDFSASMSPSLYDPSLPGQTPEHLASDPLLNRPNSFAQFGAQQAPQQQPQVNPASLPMLNKLTQDYMRYRRGNGNNSGGI